MRLRPPTPERPLMSRKVLDEAPRFGLFTATWGTFNPASKFVALTQTSANAEVLADALDTLGALNGARSHAHDLPGGACLDQLERFLDEAGDDVILYFASHGMVPSGASQFFRLATTETRDVDDTMRAFVLAEVIEKLNRRRRGRKLVIIDACYSGKAAASLLGSSGVDLDLPGDICVLFATDPFTAAHADPEDALSVFTSALADVLVNGLEGRGPQLSVRSIFVHLESALAALQAPKPWLVTTGSGAEEIAFRNAASRGSGYDFSQRVAEFDHRTEILYVDDERTFRDDFKDELEGAGHRVTVADGVTQALDALTTGYYDLIVIDLLLQDDVPATEFIQTCCADHPDSEVFLVSRRSKALNEKTGTEQRWDRLDNIFAYPSRIAAFLWKPDFVDDIIARADTIREARRATLSQIDGLDDAIKLVVEHAIARLPELSDATEGLQHELRVCVEQMTAAWFERHRGEPVYIERMTLRSVSGGRSTTTVFLMTPHLRGIDAESVTPLILKLGPRLEIEEEVRRYDRFVQVGVPLDARTDKLQSALTGRMGGVIYSFRGADDNSISEVGALTTGEIETCLDALFGTPSKRWYASYGTGDGVRPTEHFRKLNFPPEAFKKAVKALSQSIEKIQAGSADTDVDPNALEHAYDYMTGRHPATLVHGDLTFANIVRTSDHRFALIDYRTVGLGPRLVDFVTLEVAAWLLAVTPADTSKRDRFLSARRAIPTSLRDAGGLVPDPWLEAPRHLANKCRSLALSNHEDATDEEYGALLWLAAVRASYFRSRVATTAERNAQRAVLPALALAAQSMMKHDR